MLPNFLIIGAEKSGTTWIYERLRRHPQIYMPAVKELDFFGRDRESGRTLEWYEDHFCEAPAVGEKCPAYMYDPTAADQIAQLIPDVKLIASLRHPTDRTYSSYWMSRGVGDIGCSFEKVVREEQEMYVGRGRYGVQLNRYFSHFDRDQLLILIFEEIMAHPTDSLNRICSFLGVDSTFYSGQDWIAERENASIEVRSTMMFGIVRTIAKWMRRTDGARQVLDVLKATGVTELIKGANREPREYPEMDPELRKELDEQYASTVLRVERLLGRKIKVWRDKMVSGI